MAQLHEDDLKADVASFIEAFGARAFLFSFRESYPNHYRELQVQMDRLINPKQLPALLVKKENKNES